MRRREERGERSVSRRRLVVLLLLRRKVRCNHQEEAASWGGSSIACPCSTDLFGPSCLHRGGRASGVAAWRRWPAAWLAGARDRTELIIHSGTRAVWGPVGAPRPAQGRRAYRPCLTDRPAPLLLSRAFGSQGALRQGGRRGGQGGSPRSPSPPVLHARAACARNWSAGCGAGRCSVQSRSR